MKPKQIINEKLIVLFLAAVFLALALPNLYSPGLCIDEATDGLISGFIFKSLPHSAQGAKPAGNVIDPGEYAITLGNRIFPVMTGAYHGSVNAYMVFPFLRLFGFNVFSLRFASVFISLISLILIYYACKRLFGPAPAFIAGILSAVNLVFVQYGRLALYREEIFVLFFFWATLFLFTKYSETKSNIFLYSGLFFFGMGISCKVTFLWYACGMIIAYLFLRKKLSLYLPPGFKPKLAAFFSFSSGLIFLILYNFGKHWMSLKVLAESLFLYPVVKHNTAVNNLAYWGNLKIRLYHLFMFLNERIAERSDWGVARPSAVENLSLMIALFSLVAFLSVLIFTLFSRKNPYKYNILFFYIVYLTVVFLTPFTVSGFDPGHLLVLFPFPQIVMALFIGYIWSSWRGKKIIPGLVCAILLAPVFLFNIWMNIYFSGAMSKNGGYGRWSTAVYGLAQYLDAQNIRPVTFGWGLKENIAFLTRRRIEPVQYDELEFSREKSAREYKRLFSKNEPVYYLATSRQEDPGYLNLFLDVAEREGRKKTLEKTFLNRAGDPVYWLYKIY